MTDPRDAEIARLTAEINALMGANTNPLTPQDKAYVIAHLSYELEPVGDRPSWNQLAMETVRLANAVKKAEAERDAALALVAGAYLDAGWVAEQYAGGDIADIINKRTPADSTAALDRMLRQARVASVAEIETTLRGLIAGQYSSLTIGFNDDHASNYAEAKDWDYYEAENTESRIDWVSEDERVRAVTNNTVWTLQWYPETPVGFSCIGASSLTAILAADQKEADND